MSEALLEAQSAAAAILTSRDEGELDRALARWWRQRDVDALPLYYHARDLSQPDVNPALDRLVFQKLARDARLREAFTRVFRRTQSPYTLLPVARALGWVVSAVLRGDPLLVRELVARGRRNRLVLAEIERRRRLLAALDAGLRSPRTSHPASPRAAEARSA
jgi:hypothetical protein